MHVSAITPHKKVSYDILFTCGARFATCAYKAHGIRHCFVILVALAVLLIPNSGNC